MPINMSLQLFKYKSDKTCIIVNSGQELIHPVVSLDIFIDELKNNRFDCCECVIMLCNSLDNNIMFQYIIDYFLMRYTFLFLRGSVL